MAHRSQLALRSLTLSPYPQTALLAVQAVGLAQALAPVRKALLPEISAKVVVCRQSYTSNIELRHDWQTLMSTQATSTDSQPSLPSCTQVAAS